MVNINNLLLYCSLTKDEYEKIQDKVRDENARNMTAFSILAAIAFACGALFQSILGMGTGVVVETMISAFFIVIAIVSKIWGKSNKIITRIIVFLFSVLLLSVGVFSGVSQPDNRTTLLLAFYAFVAVLFSQRIITVVSLIVVSEVIYLLLIFLTQSGSVLVVNVVNTLIFSVMGSISSVYIMRMKYSKNYSEYINRYLIERDTLTSMYNRHSYVEELDRVKSNRKKVTICAFDINGLKFVNDNYGHAAGDELIIGAARCIEKVFGPYGKIFRTGGDEFIAILDKDYDSKEDLYNRFERVQEEWQGELVSEINISCGIASLEEDFEKKLSDTIILADMLMYDQKRKYYETHNVSRHI